MKSQSVIFMDRPGSEEYVCTFDIVGEEKEVLGVIIANKPGDYFLSVTSDHQEARTFGRVIIRGIVANGAKLNINGMVKIHPDAQEVDDFLEMRVLVLDDKSLAIAKPELEIEANSVKASHAATVGQIDKEQLYYLESRGIPQEDAKKIIIKGFVNQVVEKVEDNMLRQRLTKMLE